LQRRFDYGSFAAARSAASSDLYPSFRSRLNCQPCPALSRPSNLRCRSSHCRCWRRRCCHWCQRSRSSRRRRCCRCPSRRYPRWLRRCFRRPPAAPAPPPAPPAPPPAPPPPAANARLGRRTIATVAKDLRFMASLRVERVACVSRIEVCATKVGPGAMFLGRSRLDFAKSLQREARPRTSLLSRDRGS
jgi:hypothetical protein